MATEQLNYCGINMISRYGVMTMLGGQFDNIWD